jgi:uncharacterized membrane protein
MMWDNNDSWANGSGYGGWFMLIGLIVIAVAAVFLVVYLVRQTSRPVAAGAPRVQGYPQSHAQGQVEPRTKESPSDILARRYASGEIEREEYLQKLADL